MSTYTDLSDLELIYLLKKGDELAFTEVYNRYWEFLYQSCYSILKDSDSCDDIVQEIFVWLWANKERHVTDSFKPYLYAAVKYKVANLIRHGKVKTAYFERSAYINKLTAEENNMEFKELKEIIAQFTSRLPERARMIFHLSRNEFLSNKEIANQLGISEKTVENQMNINLKKLKASLGNLSFWSVFL